MSPGRPTGAASVHDPARAHGPVSTLGADFSRLWFARAASDAGTAIAMGALPLIAVRVLDASTFQVSLLTAVAGIAGALLALPLGPALEVRRKRPMMIAADLARALLLASVPLAHAAGALTVAHLLVVAAGTALAGTVFGGASAAHLKNLVPREQRTEALGRLEATFWTLSTLGPALGGAIVQLLGATATLLVQGAGLVASALGIRAIRAPEPAPPAPGPRRRFLVEASAGFTVAAAHPVLRPLLVNATLFAGFVAWTGPLELVLLLRGLDLPPWQYGLALALPCLGGVVGSWWAPRVTARLGQLPTLVWSGALRGLPVLALPFLPGGAPGLVLYVVATTLMLLVAGVFRPVYSALRMEATEDSVMTRVSTAFSLAARGAAPVFALAGGICATFFGVRGALLVGVLGLIASGLVLPWRAGRPRPPAEEGPGPDPEIDGSAGQQPSGCGTTR